jgi:hypothetical protein
MNYTYVSPEQLAARPLDEAAPIWLQELRKMLELEDVPARAVIDLAGHVSPAMLKRYSHIRMALKKKAVDALVDGQKRVAPEPSVPPKPPKPVQRLPVVHTDDAWDILQEASRD